MRATSDAPPRRPAPAFWLVAGLSLLALLAGSTAAWWAAERHPTPPPLPTPPAPRLAPAQSLDIAPLGQQPARVLLLTLDGARADFVAAYLADGTLRNLALLASSGAVAEYSQGVAPAAPATSHLSLAAGSWPRRTGIVGERYRRLGDSLTQPTSASGGPASAVPPIWAWERQRADARVAVLFWPGGQGEAAAGADTMLAFSEPLASSRRHALNLRRLLTEPAGLPFSYSPLQAAIGKIQGTAGAPLAFVWALLVDRRDDGVTAYDTVMLGLSTSETKPPAAFAPLPAAGWLTLALPDQPAAGVAFKQLALERDPALGPDALLLSLYQSEVCLLTGSPPGLAEDVATRRGPPAPAPDLADLRAGLLPSEDFLSLAGQRAYWQADVIQDVGERLTPRLTLATLDVVALAARAVLTGTTPVNLYDARLRAAYRAADSALGRLLADLDLSQSTVLVGSPHGYAGATTAFNLETLLSSWLPGEERRLLTVYSSGGSAHIVFNLSGREPRGSMLPAEAERLTLDLARRLAEFRLGERPAFARVLTHESLRELRLEHPNSGDIFVEAAPGIILVEVDPSGAGRLSWPVGEGASGYTPSRPEMRGFFLLAGRRVGRWGLIGPTTVVDWAPTAAALAGLHIPAGVEGRVLNELLNE